MNTRLKLAVEEALNKVLDDHIDNDAWDMYIHPGLVKQMANAVEIVFDASEDSQKYFETESDYDRI